MYLVLSHLGGKSLTTYLLIIVLAGSWLFRNRNGNGNPATWTSSTCTSPIALAGR